MGLIQEFKKFAIKGNMLDMAVGIVMGGAFGAVVKSLVDDVIMPPIGKLTGDRDFSDLFISLGDGAFDSLAAAREAGAATLNYGVFANAIINFVIVAAALFVVVKAFNAAKKKEDEAPAAPPEPPKQEVLLEEIRDLLKSQG